MSEKYTVEDIAKLMADFIGHGMTEKCERHAQAIMPILESIERETAEKCAEIAQELKLKNKKTVGVCNPYNLSDAVGEIHSHFNLGENS